MSRTLIGAFGADRSVSDTMADLRSRVRPGESVALHALVDAPIAQVRLIDLPRMSVDDARRAVSRCVGRYFPDVFEPQAVSVIRVGTRWLIAAAPTSLVNSIHEQARSLGWNIAITEPAYCAWARSAREGVVRIRGATETAILECRRGMIVGIRRFRAAVPLPPVFAASRDLVPITVGTDAILGSVPPRHRLDFVPDQIRSARAHVARRVSRYMCVAAAALLVFAALTTLWGERRELNALRARREELREDVENALERRDTLLHTVERLNAVAFLGQSAERWSDIISQVASTLPPDASLTSFRAEADSVTLEGQADDAAGVFAAMRAAPTFVAVRASAPIRQEGSGIPGQPVIERFSLGARVRSRPDRRASNE